MTANIPLAAPSANPSGFHKPYQRGTCMQCFSMGKITGVLNGGACTVGLESTVIGFENDAPVLLRAGGLSNEDIEKP
eukprot:UN15420